MKGIRSLILVVLFWTGSLHGQDIHYSQIYNSALNLNPALTGSFNGNLRVNLNWKDQWRTVGKSFQTYAFSFDQNVLKTKVGKAYFAYGINFYQDIAGEVKLGTTRVLGSLAAYIWAGRRGRISLGLQAGWGRVGVDPTRMRWGTQYDGLQYNPFLPSGETNQFNPFSFADVSAGMTYWFSSSGNRVTHDDAKDFRIGFAVHHLNRPRNAYYTDERLPMKFVIHGNGYFGVKNTTFGIWPSFSFLYQKPHWELMVGTLFRTTINGKARITGFRKEMALSFGAHFRISSPFDAIIPEMYFEIQGVGIGVTYDVNISKLSTASNLQGGMELSLRYILDDKYYYQRPTHRVPSF
ncbi:MAG: PorP/SprF family type IX secretion system membrane protein [Crocinitomicaceae bacterium]|nr:PorP/SprF family type IX secretion system membrane protein [Crocinitomicaceae bacterium]